MASTKPQTIRLRQLSDPHPSPSGGRSIWMKCVVSRDLLQALRGSHVPGGPDLLLWLIRPAAAEIVQGWPESPHCSEDAAWPGAPAGRTVQSTGPPVSLLRGSGTAEEHVHGARAEAMVVWLQPGTSLNEIEQLMLHTAAPPQSLSNTSKKRCQNVRTAAPRSVARSPAGQSPPPAASRRGGAPAPWHGHTDYR